MDVQSLQSAALETHGRLPASKATLALILGSGWGHAVDSMRIRHELPYSDIPCLGSTGVEGHRGRLLAAEIDSVEVLVFEGRRHWYEGEGWEPVALPIYICIKRRISTLVLTNAAGGIRDDLVPGRFMVIDDHINAMGASPLMGPHDPSLGSRFPDQTAVYSRPLGEALDSAAQRAGETPAHGVYLATAGPTYETPAEIRAYRAWGADAVGMSTVPEAMLAHAAGIEVAGLSCITNRAAGTADHPLSHDDVVSVTRDCAPRMLALLTAFIASQG